MEQDARERLVGYIDTDEDVETELEKLLGYNPSMAQVNAVEREAEIRADDAEPTATGGGVVQDFKGRFFGSKENVFTWQDRWGNTIGYNEKTGERRKLVDAR